LQRSGSTTTGTLGGGSVKTVRGKFISDRIVRRKEDVMSEQAKQEKDVDTTTESYGGGGRKTQ